MFGETLKKLRSASNVNQNDLARILNISRQAYGSYERGISTPDIKQLSLIADFFNCSTDYLLGRTTEKNISQSRLTNDELDLIEKYRNLNQADKEVLFRVFSGLSNTSQIKTALSDKSESAVVKNNISEDELDIALNYRILDEIDKGEVRGTIKTMLKHEKYSSPLYTRLPSTK